MKAVPERWLGPYPSTGDIGFLQNWLEDELGPEASGARGINFSAIAGMALSVAIGAGFWTGVALIVQRVWR